MAKGDFVSSFLEPDYILQAINDHADMNLICSKFLTVDNLHEKALLIFYRVT